MKGFNFNNINVKKVSKPKKEDGGDVPVEKLLTGEFVKEIPEAIEDQANVEVEKNEYIKYPNGDIEKVLGDTHEKGGVKLSLPEGAQIISDNLKLGADAAKELSKLFDVKLKAKDTYAEAIDKYNKTLGLDKLNDKQEDYIKKLKDESETKDETTRNTNFAFLNEKIRDVELEKEPLLGKRVEFFDELFRKQEISKGVDVQDEFKLGGMVSSKEFKDLLNKFGIEKEEGIRILQDGGVIPKFNDGGTLESLFLNKKITEDQLNDAAALIEEGLSLEAALSELGVEIEGSNEILSDGNVEIIEEEVVDIPVDNKLATPVSDDAKLKGEEKKKVQKQAEDISKRFFERNVFQDDAPGFQSESGAGAFGGINSTNAFLEYQRILPALADKYKDDAASFQEAYNVSGKTYLNFLRKQGVGEEEIKEVESFINSTNFTEDPGDDTGRGKDALRGKFTSSRPGFKYNIYEPQKIKKLADEGITHLSQLKNRLDEVSDILTPEELDKARAIFENPEFQDLDFKLGEIKTTKVETETPKKEEKPKKDVVQSPVATSDKTVKQRGPQGFIFPDQSKLPPSPLQLPTLNVNRRQRIDPIKVGIEDNLTELFKQQDFVAKQIDNVPDSQRAAALSNLLASTQENANKAITSANRINAQNQQAAELFNIRQSDAEDQLRGVNLQNYERLAQTAIAKTDKDLRDFFDFNKRVALDNLKSQQRLNLIDAQSPDFTLDVFGNPVFDPETNFQLGAQTDRVFIIGQDGKPVQVDLNSINKTEE